jgi:MFS family permease
MSRIAVPEFVRSLRSYNFRLYFFGQAVSLLGSWIQQVALVWLVYRLTGSAALLGVTTFVSLAPQLLLGPLAGAWIDRQDKRRWLIGVQLLLATQALVLAVLTAGGWIGPATIIAMSALLGVLGSFDAPLRHSLISAYVEDRADLPNALALNSMLVNGGRFIGPPIAGLLLGLTSEAACFALNALSFIALVVAVLRARAGSMPAPARGSVGHVFKEGARYVWDTWFVRILIGVVAAVNITASSYATLLPVFAKDVFVGDAQTLGWLWGAVGAGAFAGTLVLVGTRSLPRLSQGVVGAVALSAVALGVVAAAGTLAPAFAGLVVLGFGITVVNAGVNMLLQSCAPETLRGRVVSFFMATRFGFDAIGGLIAGLLASLGGVRVTLWIEAALLTTCLVFLFLHRQRLEAAIVH